MKRLLLILFLGGVLQGSAKAQCDTGFYVNTSGATAWFYAADSSLTLTHQWKFGDGTQGWGAQATHTYSLPGTYVVTHIVSDTINNCRDSAKKIINISFAATCSAAFVAKRDSTFPDKYYIYSTSTVSGGVIQSYKWTINGNTIMAGAAFIDTLPAGLNTICLTIKTTGGCTSTTCDSIWVDTAAHCNWSASFTYAYDSINPRKVRFTPSPVLSGLSYSWTFGDGFASNMQSPTHTYSTPGAYPVTLTVIDSAAGCWDTARRRVIIISQGQDTCKASFTARKDSITANKYYFTSTSQAGAGNTYSYKWTINGDSVSAAQAFNYLLDSGLNIICLTIRTTAGCTSTKCDSIRVDTTTHCSWSASFTYAYDSINPAKVRFTPSPVLPGLSYSWTFGDGFTSNIQSPTHIYSTPGTYPVALTITGAGTGCVDTARRYIIIIPKKPDTCTASFTYTVNPAQPNQYAFTALSSDSVITYHWLIEPCDSTSTDSVTYNTANPVHTFTSSGCYRVCLHLLTKNGCRRSYCDTVVVNHNPAESLITSFPNPVQGANVQLRLDLPQVAKVKITVYNSFGHAVFTNERNYSAGQNRLNIPVDKLQRGLYYIDIHYGNNRKRSVFQKL